MFEKDEGYRKARKESKDKITKVIKVWSAREETLHDAGFENGAEFGYNKANEWHYVNWKYFADKDHPKSETALYLVQLRNKDVLICDWETEEGFGCFWDNLQPIDNDDVYAWKEIVLPKEIEK